MAMFSTDNNVQTIGQLVEVLKDYIGFQKEFVKLDVIEKVVRLITVATLLGILTASILMIAIFGSFAAAYALAPKLGMAASFCIVAAFYLVLFLLIFAFRKQWIEKPVVKILASILMD